MKAECGRQDGSPRGTGYDFLEWADWTVVLLEAHCLARTTPTSYWKGSASVRADIHSPFNASFTKYFLLCCGVTLEGRSSSSLSERTFTSLLQQDYRWHIQMHHWMHWASLQTPWGGWGSGIPHWRGQVGRAGWGEGLLAVKSHLLRPWEGVVVTRDIGHYGLLIRP